MEIIHEDLVIIGGGAAGLRAAIKAAEINPKLKIALISKVYPIRSHTVSAEGGVAAVLKEYDSLEKHAFDTIKSSDYLADQDVVEYFVKNAPEEIIRLEHFGCPWSRDDDGKIAVRAFGGMSVKRTCYASDKTGFYLLHSLFEQTLKYENIRRYDECFVTRLFHSNGNITGLTAIDMQKGKLHAFNAKAVILAAGGAGRVFSFTSNAGIKTGDGMALALRIGVPLKDMEFIQFHPTGLLRTGILVTEAARGEGGHLINKNGERFMERYDPKMLELAPRDVITRAIINEINEGRGLDSSFGKHVLLDLRHLGERRINTQLPQVKELCAVFASINPVVEPIPVRPVAHYFMGGIHTNKLTQTNVKGLFAAGETACLSVNGANRLGSNSLAECLVFGSLAGERASEAAASNKTTELDQEQVEEEEKRILSLLHKDGEENPSDLRNRLRSTMDQCVGTERDKKSLEKALIVINDLKRKLSEISIKDPSLLFNTELTSYLELENMIDIAECVALSAIRREESRGAHYRTDFPSPNDNLFLKHLLISKTSSGMIMGESPVTITKWHPKV